MTSDPSRPDPPPTRWETSQDADGWQAYRDRFGSLLESGADLGGEARLLDAMLPRHADVLDAGCGTGRVTDALRVMGHRVIGVDRDAGLVAAAREWYPRSRYLVADLSQVTPQDLHAVGGPTAFDLVALPGNVLVFVAPGTERLVLGALAALLKPGGRIVTGFATDREYTVADLDDDAAALGLQVEHRFATWDLEPWVESAGWAVTVLRAG